jgi:hypothetical protein
MALEQDRIAAERYNRLRETLFGKRDAYMLAFRFGYASTIAWLLATALSVITRDAQDAYATFVVTLPLPILLLAIISTSGATKGRILAIELLVLLSILLGFVLFQLQDNNEAAFFVSVGGSIILGLLGFFLTRRVLKRNGTF